MEILKDDLDYILSSFDKWGVFSNSTVLITGASGLLPAYMVESLLALNKFFLVDAPCKVIALVRNEEYAKKRFADYLDNDYLNFLVQDVSEVIKIDEKIDYIIHAASPASPKYYDIDPVGVILPNILGTKNTLELAVKHKVSGYLFFSSGEVYGELPNGEVINESSYGYLDPTSVRACYGESKRMGENLCISYGHQYNIPIKIVRPFHTYGPGMKLDDGRVFADFVSDIVNNCDIVIKSDGKAKRPFCYLADATIAFFKVLIDGDKNNAYNVANSDQLISIRDLAQILVKMFPEKKLKLVFSEQDTSYLKSSIKEQVVDVSKLKSLGWSPRITVIDGFKKTVRSYEV